MTSAGSFHSSSESGIDGSSSGVSEVKSDQRGLQQHSAQLPKFEKARGDVGSP